MDSEMDVGMFQKIVLKHKHSVVGFAKDLLNIRW